MREKWLSIFVLIMMMLFVFSQSVFAFSDIKGDVAEKEILDLKDKGIVNGVKEDIFDPNSTITYAAGVHLVVKAFNLTIDHLKFIKEPTVNDYYTSLEENRWYSNSFINVHLNGIELPNDITPNQKMTKEQFSDLLFKAMVSKHEFAFIELWVTIEDQESISTEYMNSIQKLIISNIAELEDGNNFNAKSELTRSEAALMLHRALTFVNSYQEEIAEID